MDFSRGPAEIEEWGDMLWGTHFCFFYETRQDLLETIVAYFKEGLESHDYCLWLTSASGVEEARKALRQAIPGIDEIKEKGEIEILPARQWYLEDGVFDSEGVINKLNTKLAQALAKGYARLRVAADEAWLEQTYWTAFLTYEKKLDEVTSDKDILILCAYPTSARTANDILDIAWTHRFAAAKRSGKWEILEAPELKRALQKARDELEEKVQERTTDLIRINQALQAEIVEHKRTEKALRESETKLKEAQQLAHIGYWERDLIADRITGSEETHRIFGLKSLDGILSLADLQEMIYPDDRQIQRQALIEALQGRRLYDVEYRIVRPDGDLRFVHVRDEIEYDELGRPIRMFGAVQDVTERKHAEEATRQQAARAQLLADISQSCAEAGLDYQKVLETITWRTAELIGDACMILQLSEDRQRLRPAAFHHPNPQAFALMQEILSNAWTGSLDAPISGNLLAGEPVRIPEVTSEEIRPLIPHELWPFVDRVGISSLLAVPLRVQGQVIGILSLSRDRPGLLYTQEDQALLQDIADRAALTIENARLFQSVSEQRERLRALSARLVEAREVERRTVARELHDEVGQLLTGLQITLKMSSRLAPEAARARLSESQKLVEQLLDRVQNLSLDLRPAVLDDLGLVPALLWQFERYTRQTGIQVRFDHRGLGRRFASEVETAVYRIVQEGLTNVARYAGVQEAVVRVWTENSTLGLQIEDLGTSFDVQYAQDARTSTGLSGMQEQAELLGGQLTIESAPGAGTLITVELPLREAQEGDHDERDDTAGR